MIDFKEKANLIWKVADLLRGDYKQSDYGKVILPMTVLRRLDCVLAPTKQKVLDYLPKIEKLSDGAKDVTLNKVAQLNFHNRSKYDFAKLIADSDNIAANLRNFINGFSVGAREILEYFSFEAQIEKLDDPKTDMLFQVVKAFVEIDLSGMDTMQMGYVFEELIRKFAELSNETAGEHFTPREVIKFMVNVLFITNRDMLTRPGLVKTLYDPACGTGGMLSVAESYLIDLNPKAKLSVTPYLLAADSTSLPWAYTRISFFRAGEIACPEQAVSSSVQKLFPFLPLHLILSMLARRTPLLAMSAAKE